MKGLTASIKNIKQNIQENIIQCWFYGTNIESFGSKLAKVWGRGLLIRRNIIFCYYNFFAIRSSHDDASFL